MIKKEIVSILQDIIGPIFTTFMFTATFVTDLVKEADSPLIEVAVAILVLSFAAFYVARARSIWLYPKENKKKDQKDES